MTMAPPPIPVGVPSELLERRPDIAAQRAHDGRQVEDGLAEVRILSKEIQQEQQAMNSAQTSLKLEQARYETGIDPYVDVLMPRPPC